MEEESEWTPEVWEQFAEIPLEHWVALSPGGKKIIASGRFRNEVGDEANKKSGGQFTLISNPRGWSWLRWTNGTGAIR